MSTASALIFAAVPVIAALSLHMDLFVPFFILFCVAAGLSMSDRARPRGRRRQQAAEFARF